MQYLKFQPAPPLRPYIHQYYHLRDDSPVWKAMSVAATPSGDVGMVFNFGADYFVEKDGVTTQSPGCFLAGQVTKKYFLHFKDKVDVIGVVFAPTALLPLLGLPMIDFVDQQVELSQAIGLDASVLYHRMATHDRVESRLAILEQYLIKRLEDRGKTDLVAERGISQIVSKRGKVSIRKLADDLCISQRQFHRRFTEVVGISPKRFARIKRLNHIANSLPLENTDWSTAVYTGGYYDQSHFIRDFQDFFGQNPSQFLEYKSKLTRLAAG